MSTHTKLLSALALIVLLASGEALLGRGGGGGHGGGAGFHGGGDFHGGGEFHGGGVFRGGEAYHGGGEGRGGDEYRGGEENRGGGNEFRGHGEDLRSSGMFWGGEGHTPSFSQPRMSEDHFRSNTASANWSNYGARSEMAGRSGFDGRPAPGPGPHPGPGPGPHPGPHPGPGPGPGPHPGPGPGPGPHPGPGPGPGPHPGPGPGPGPHPGPGPNPNWNHGQWPNNWNHPWNNWPATWWSAGFWAGAGFEAAEAPWCWGYWHYYNPYCGGGSTVVVDGTTIDYSEPLAMAAPSAANANSPAATDRATELLDAAHNAFQQADYTGALAQCDKAIALQPNDPLLHEFRGLALFALQRYDEAAGAIYAVLSAGPGWDWTTLSGLYPDVSLYTEQLRTLERYVTLHPASTAAKFLLAYHYTTCGYNDAAAAQLKAVVQLDPKDQLSAQLLSLLKPNSVAPQPVQSVAGRPAEAAALVGNWIADRGDGETIALSLTKDGQYTWKLDQHGKVQQFSGPYTVADSLLVLKKGQTPVMIGQASLLANDRFNFKLPGDNPSDPGLTFGR